MVVTMHDLLAVMREHVGRSRGATAEYLAVRLDTTERRVRMLATELRNEGIALCAHPRDGYYIADTPEEVEQTCQFLRARAMHSLRLEANLRKLTLPELLGQMRLNT